MGNWFFSAVQNGLWVPTYFCLFFGESLQILLWDSSRKTMKNHHLWENTLDGTNPAPVDKPVYPIIYTVFWHPNGGCLGFLPWKFQAANLPFFREIP